MQGGSVYSQATTDLARFPGSDLFMHTTWESHVCPPHELAEVIKAKTGFGCSSVVAHLPSVLYVSGFILITVGKKIQKVKALRSAPSGRSVPGQF